jgi:hypothetical protein
MADGGQAAGAQGVRALMESIAELDFPKAADYHVGRCPGSADGALQAGMPRCCRRLTAPIRAQYYKNVPAFKNKLKSCMKTLQDAIGGCKVRAERHAGSWFRCSPFPPVLGTLRHNSAPHAHPPPSQHPPPRRPAPHLATCPPLPAQPLARQPGLLEEPDFEEEDEVYRHVGALLDDVYERVDGSLDGLKRAARQQVRRAPGQAALVASHPPPQAQASCGLQGAGGAAAQLPAAASSCQ